MMRLPRVFCHWGTEGTSWGPTSRRPLINFRENGPYSSTEKNDSSSPKVSNMDTILSTFSLYRGSLLVNVTLAFLHRYPACRMACLIVHNEVMTPSVFMAVLRSTARQLVRAKPYDDGGECNTLKRAAFTDSDAHFGGVRMSENKRLVAPPS